MTNRRGFCRHCLDAGAGFALAAILGVDAQLTAAPQVQRQVSYVAGAPYRIGFQTGVDAVFQRGQRLRAAWQPANQHDPEAIALYAGLEQVGYLPRRGNEAVARALAAGQPVQVHVRSVNAANPWEGVRIELHWLG